MPTGTYRKELVDWLRGLYGPDRPYRTARRLSLAAGRNQNAVATIEERGHATAEVLVDLARTAGVSPLEAFRRAGWLTEEEVSAKDERIGAMTTNNLLWLALGAVLLLCRAVHPDRPVGQYD